MQKNRWKNWMQGVYYFGTLATLIFIMAQAYYARRSIIQSSEWEKAKMTIDNIEHFKKDMSISPLSKNNVWMLGDGIWADASNPEKKQLFDTLSVVYWSLFNDKIDAVDELIRMIEAMDAFAYPIIMGYASETTSYQSVMRQYYTYGNFIMPFAFNQFPNIGLHAKLLYRLWRLRYEITLVDNSINSDEMRDMIRKQVDHLLCYEGTDITEASLKEYRKKLNGKLKDVQKEIEVFRENSLK